MGKYFGKDERYYVSLTLCMVVNFYTKRTVPEEWLFYFYDHYHGVE